MTEELSLACQNNQHGYHCPEDDIQPDLIECNCWCHQWLLDLAADDDSDDWAFQ